MQLNTMPKLTVQERLEAFKFGVHNCRLEGLVLPKEEQDLLISWVVQGLTVEEMISRVMAQYNVPPRR